MAVSGHALDGSSEATTARAEARSAGELARGPSLTADHAVGNGVIVRLKPRHPMGMTLAENGRDRRSRGIGEVDTWRSAQVADNTPLAR